MVRRRVIALAIAAAFATVGATASAQQRGGDQKNQPKRSKQEQQEINTLYTAVDAVMKGGTEPASDIQLALTPYFLKAEGKNTYVPFALRVTNAPKTDTAMYVRLVPAGGPAPEPPPPADAKEKENNRDRGRQNQAKPPEYPWEDVHFVPASALSQEPAYLYRAVMAPPGKYDLYIAMKERTPEKPQKDATQRMGMLKTTVDVPDYWSGDLLMSSIIVSDEWKQVTAAPTAQELRERPFVFGNQEIVPATDTEFTSAEELGISFQVYGAAADPSGKPNVTMEYNFHRKEGAAEKFFNRVAPQVYDATTMPPTFDLAKFPVPGGVTVPLKSFPPGEYRLEIKVTDKVSGKVLQRDVPFTVKGAA